jgi:hypothetical protein
VAIHDWTRVPPGTWHDLHLAWVVEIQRVLNTGLLPPDYYAQAEQLAGPVEAAFLDAQVPTSRPEEAELAWSVLKRRTIVIRHSGGDQIIALLEIVSPGNKVSRHEIRSFVEKAVEALYRGYHLLVVDLFPPTTRDPNGIHGAIWAEFCDSSFELPAGEPLTLAAWSAGPRKRAYIEPTAVGRELIDMPLFLEPELYVNVPLEATYRAAYRGVPRRWQRVLEAPPGGMPPS